MSPSIPVESLQNEVSRILQQIIPLLDALHTLPFQNLWLNQAPGKHYLQFLDQTEKICLWSWQRLQHQEQRRLQLEISSWEGGQTRKPDGLLQQYYQFNEALAQWAQQQPNEMLRGQGMWQDYIVFILGQEKHLLHHCSSDSIAPQREELALIAQQYLRQMQQIHDLDLFTLCLDVFTFFGVFTRKSYFIPQLTFPLAEEKSPAPSSPFDEFRQKLQDSPQWSELASEYLEVIG